ncbi:MAG: 2,3-bisphosphoglycerate-independent phosphoglycerate mutase [Schleiferiaceae bacterium]
MRKAVLIILDGWGLPADPSVSAIDLGSTPFYDSLRGSYPHSQLEASGRAVGLPDGQMGNSEVGHMNLGAGRIVYQDLVRIDLALETGELAQNPVFADLAQRGTDGQRIHLLGLVSDGGVHSHIAHLKGILTELATAGASNVFVHAFTDGRDTDPQSGEGFIGDLEAHLAQTTGRLATLTGRYYAMDRDKRWERVKLAYDALVHAEGTPWQGTGREALAAAYAQGTTDEFLLPHILDPNGCIRPGDAVFFFNYRTDRGRELTQALSQGGLDSEGMAPVADLHYVTMTRYDANFKGINVVFEKDNLSDTLGEVLERAGKTQIRIAETEKYPHVTFFFSGGREEPFVGESRILRSSPKVATYDLQPEMSAYELRDALIPELVNGSADFVCLNFANPDMVGHTGVLEAAIKACETVDQCTQAVVEAGLNHGYSFFILADHGNADCMRNPDGSPHTAHTTRPVPFFLVTPEPTDGLSLADGVLGDVAPTILDWMGIPQPAAMTGTSLLRA